MTLQAEAYFGKDSARLRGSATAELGQVTADLRRRGPGRVLIVGNTDDLGSKAHRLMLSPQRATAVAGVLRGRLPAGRDHLTPAWSRAPARR